MSEQRTAPVTFRDPFPSRQRQVMEAIKDFILERGLNPGDLLPTESELMKQLGASRNALREAIKALQPPGFAVDRQGTGTSAGAIQTRAMHGGRVASR